MTKKENVFVLERKTTNCEKKKVEIPFFSILFKTCLKRYHC